MKKRFLAIACTLFIVAVVLFTPACKKNSPGSGKLLVAHASPDAGAIDVLIDNSKINTSALSYPGNTGYTSAPEGNHSIRINGAGTANSLISATFGIESNENYSLFVYDRAASIKLLYTVDVLNNPAPDKAYVRFFHFSPNAPTVTMGTLNGTTFTPLFENRSFETQNTALTNSNFTAITPGTYNFDVRVAGAGVSLFTVNNVNLQGGKIYTVFAKGLAGNATTPLGAEIMANN